MVRGKASNGDGSIRQLPNGTWQVRLSLGNDPCTGKKQYAYATFPTWAEANKWKRAKTSEIDNGTFVKPSHYTLAKWLDIWLETYASGLSDVAMYKSQFKNYLRPYLGGSKAADLTPANILTAYGRIQKDYQQKHGKPMSAKTLRNIHSKLSSVMEAFVSEGGRKENPCKYVTKRLPPVQKPDLPQLEEQEIARVLQAADESPFGNLFKVDFFTGLRQAELLGLCWSDIDFEGHSITVRGQLRKPRQKGEAYLFAPTKNRKTRTICPPEITFEVLRNERKRQLENRMRAGDAWNEGDLHGLVFTNELGGHLVHVTVSKHFKKLLKTAGVTEVRFHDMRHSATALLFASGADPVTTQKYLGHASAKFTQEQYAYLFKEQRARTANKLDEYITQHITAQKTV